MFPTLVRRLAQPAKEALGKRAGLSMANNPYKTRKEWPPNFKELNPQQQLRFEKKYKRRILLAGRSPRWEKGVKYAQLVTMTAAVVWIIFYGEFDWWGQKYKPSEEVRLLYHRDPAFVSQSQLPKRAAQLFGALDAEKRYERRPDAPPPPPPKEPESK